MHKLNQSRGNTEIMLSQNSQQILRMESQTSGSGQMEQRAVFYNNIPTRNNKQQQSKLQVNWYQQSQNSKNDVQQSSVGNSQEGGDFLNDTQNSQGEKYDNIDIAFDLSNTRNLNRVSIGTNFNNNQTNLNSIKESTLNGMAPQQRQEDIMSSGQGSSIVTNDATNLIKKSGDGNASMFQNIFDRQNPLSNFKNKMMASESTNIKPKNIIQNLKQDEDSIDQFQNGNASQIEFDDQKEHLVSLESNMKEYAIRSHDQRGRLIPNINLQNVKCQVEKKKSQLSVSMLSSNKAASQAFVSMESSLESDISSNSDSEISVLDQVEPEQQILEHIEKYYEDNYNVYDVINQKDYVHNKVWSIHIDELYDLVYVVMANIQITKGDVQSTVNDLVGIKDQAKKAWGLLAKKTQTMNEIDAKDFQRETNALKIMKNMSVIFELKFQIFNLDDRIVKSKKRFGAQQPHVQKIILRTKESIKNSMSTFQVMQYLQNKYMDLAQIIQHDDLTYLFKDFYHMTIFDVAQKNFPYQPIKIFQDSKMKTFRSVIHTKNEAKGIKIPQNVLIFGYRQVEIESKETIKDFVSNSPADSGDDYKGQNRQREYKQQLVLKTIVHDDIKQASKNQNLAQKSNQIVQNQEVLLKDEKLIEYYQENILNRQLNNFFVQRIDDSQTYIILFPTGLMITVGTNPLNIQSKVQLTLKQDEYIQDYSYQISQDGKYHCIWILDSKLQVWKCQNERNPNQIVWTMSRIFIFHKLVIKKFFQQASSFDEFQMVTFLDNLGSYTKQQQIKLGPSDYMIAFNGTCTKMIIVCQPVAPLENDDALLQAGKFSKTFEGSVADYVIQHFSMTSTQLKACQISIQLISKDQSILMNHIPLKSMAPKKTIESKSLTLKSPKGNQNMNMFADIMKQKYKIQDIQNLDDNEILELQYLRKIAIKDHKTKSKKLYRQFVVRRKRNLQIMYTNGLSHWVDDVPNSHLQAPYVIQDILLSQNNSTLIDYVSIPGQPQKSFYRVFKYITRFQNFQHEDQNQIKGTRDLNNYCLDSNEDPYYIQIELTPEKVKNNMRAYVKINRDKTSSFPKVALQIPKSIIFPQFLAKNNVSKILPSDDGRVLMCNYLVIQLSENQENIQEVGVICLTRDHSEIQYKFQSLLDIESRKVIQTFLKSGDLRTNFVKFDIENEPLTILKGIDIIYFCNYLNDPNQNAIEGTSIAKLSINSLNCIEVYRSKQRILHFALYDQVQESEAHVDQDEDISEDELENFMAPFSKLIGQDEVHDAMTKVSKKFGFDQNILSSKALNKKPNIQQLLKLQQPKMDESSESVVAPVELKSFEVMLDKQSIASVSSPSGPNEFPQSQRSPGLKASLTRKETKVGDLFDAKKKASLKAMKKELSKKPIYLSLVSQSKNKINIEILYDNNLHKITKEKMFKKACAINIDEDLSTVPAKLVHLINVNVAKELTADSEIGWINMKQFILTLDNRYYLITLNEEEMHTIRPGLKFSRQQVSVGIFVSTVSQDYLIEIQRRSATQVFDRQSIKLNNNHQTMIKSQDVIQRMEIASLIRFAFIKHAQNSIGINKSLLFFTPCEEMKGGSIFSKLSNNYEVIQPYIEKVDSNFITILNNGIRNINNYLNKSIQKGKFVPVCQSKDHFHISENLVHMYQEDMSGKNAIDNAFEKNSIFCIKAFVDSLLQLTDEMQFKNCFDKALLLMINKGMDVKELVRSTILYPPLWMHHTVFSPDQNLTIQPYNNELDDIEFEDPKDIFKDNYMRNSKNKNQNGSHIKDSNDTELYEMQFNYINLSQICGNGENDLEVLNLAKSLKETEDLRLFELEAVQVIIDYKWETYGRQFFINQLVMFCTYIVFFQLDMETISSTPVNGLRIKDFKFYAFKVICLSLQCFFLFYKLSQLYLLKIWYFSSWDINMQVASLLFYILGAYLDFTNDYITDNCKIVYSMSMLLSLTNTLRLIKVFKEFSYLVIMMSKVAKDLITFMFLFSFFIFTFASSYQIVQVDDSVYGRLPSFVGMILSTYRSSLGDFAIIDLFQGFDYWKQDVDSDDPDSKIYLHSLSIVTFTFFIFVIQTLITFMVFINFMIAVISDSYSTITEFSDAHDYKERVNMIFERELYFTKNQTLDKKLFPKLLIVRKQKQSTNENNSIQNQIKQIKMYISEQSSQNQLLIHEKSNEQKEHQNNSMKFLENEFETFKKQQSNIEKILKKHSKVLLGLKDKGSTQNLYSTQNLDSEGIFSKGQTVKLLGYQDNFKSSSQIDSADANSPYRIDGIEKNQSQQVVNYTEPGTRNYQGERQINSYIGLGTNQNYRGNSQQNIKIRDDEGQLQRGSAMMFLENDKLDSIQNTNFYNSISQQIIKEVENPIIKNKVQMLKQNYDVVNQENEYLKQYIARMSQQINKNESKDQMNNNNKPVKKHPSESIMKHSRSKTPHEQVLKKFELKKNKNQEKLKQFGQSNQPQIRQALDKRNLVRHKQFSPDSSPKISPQLSQDKGEQNSFTPDDMDSNTEKNKIIDFLNSNNQTPDAMINQNVVQTPPLKIQQLSAILDIKSEEEKQYTGRSLSLSSK